MAKFVIVIALTFLSMAPNNSEGAECWIPPREVGTQNYPASSCKEIAVQKPDAVDRIYYLYNSAVSNASFPVYCNITSGGHTMVYKVVGGVRGRAADMWINPGTVNAGELAALNPNNVFQSHYKSIIVDNWINFGPQEVAVVLYNGGQEVIRLVFDSINSTKTDWFTKDSLTSSPYSDIISSTHNFFSISGDEQFQAESNIDRNFFINKNYGGCPSDSGWLVVISGKDDFCEWAQGEFISIKYARRTTVTNWNTPYTVAEADVMAVFVR